MIYRSTKQVAKLFGLRTNYIQTLIWSERFDAPEKGPGNAYLWTPHDIERASWAIRHRDASDILPPKETIFSQAI